MKHLIILIIASFLYITPAFAQGEQVIHDPLLDFRKFQGRDAYEWFKEKNFILERSAADRASTKYTLTEKGLVADALKPAQSIVALKKGYLTNYRDVEIVWGVNKFPPGASYLKGQRNEAVMMYAFFGRELIDSGSMIVPDSPYFIALQLCENDPVGVPMKGGYFHEGGRFICVAHPKPGEAVKTRFNLKEAFKKIYGKDAPPLYGIAFEFDTNGAKDNGTASSFVQSIGFPGADYVKPGN